MSKVLVDRELLEMIEQLLDILPESKTIRMVRELLAQPAEVEGVEVVAYADPKAFENFKTLGSKGGVHGHEWMWAKPDGGLVGMVREDAHLAALSAVTAEQDAERDQAREWLKEHYELQAERDQLRAEVESLRKDAERYRWLRDQAPMARAEWEIGGKSFGMMRGTEPVEVDATVDAAMAAKEA